MLVPAQFEFLPAAGHVPETDGGLATTGCQRLAVRGEGQGMNVMLVSRERRSFLIGRQVPESNRRLPPSHGQCLPVRRERETLHRVIQLGKLLDGLPCGYFPE